MLRADSTLRRVIRALAAEPSPATAPRSNTFFARLALSLAAPPPQAVEPTPATDARLAGSEQRFLKLGPVWRLSRPFVAATVLLAYALVVAQWLGAQPSESCSDRAARIGEVSPVAPGHIVTVTVTVCHEASVGHEYWLMNYWEENGLRIYFAKAKIGSGVFMNARYQVVGAVAEKGNTRTFVVVEVSHSVGKEIENMMRDDEPLIAPPGATVPSGLTIVSNESFAVL